MAHSVYEQYLENEILHADPVKLVGILYRAALDAIRSAGIHLQNEAIRERSLSITRAMEILNHLMLGLDHAEGGEVSRNLAELYAYMLGRLVEANTSQTAPPLAEVESLLSTLLEGWDQVQIKTPSTIDPVPLTTEAEPANFSLESVSY